MTPAQVELIQVKNGLSLQYFFCNEVKISGMYHLVKNHSAVF
jgi:hypothetical protein